jgi:hypothetical protein
MKPCAHKRRLPPNIRHARSARYRWRTGSLYVRSSA